MFNFKLTTTAIVTALAATLNVAASPLESRQDTTLDCDSAELVTCTLTATPAGVPDTSKGELDVEWIVLAGTNYAQNLPPGLDGLACLSGNSTVTGPNESNVYTVVVKEGHTELSAAQSSAVMQAAFNAATVPGILSGVNWTVGGITCDA